MDKDELIKKRWVEENKPVCICKGIRGKTIIATIEKGADSVEKVIKKTEAGKGSCQGSRCSSVIADMVERYS